MDIYEKSSDHQFIIEIQRIDYDYNFDRFLHYFLTLISNQQKNASEYKFTQRVLGVVVFARPYRFDQKDGQPIRDSVMIMDFNPKNLKGDMIKLYEHSMVFLNSSIKYKSTDTPKRYQDWLDLLYASIKEPVNYRLNLHNKGIAKAVNIIDYDKIDPVTLQKMKENESRKSLIKLIEREGKREEQIKLTKNCINEGLPNELISKLTGLSFEAIQKIRNEKLY